MNNMKKRMNWLLMVVLVCGLSLSVTSCKDDDDDNKSEEQQQQEQEAQASKFWSVVGQLVSSADYTDDYQDKTFEPTYGIADATNETTRIVETNDMQTAASYFADLVGATDINEETPSYTYSDPEVGTLTYTRGGSPAEWATVDVNIKQVPRLRKIVYRQGSEGTNAAAAQKAWYRFGDVVKRTVNGKEEYWICVRPAFSPEGKSDSHWVCLNSLPTKNIFNYAYQSKTWTVPTGVGTNKKQMQNLAEMLFAITFPNEWYENANNYHTDGKVWGFSGLPIFNDFSKANLMYHNEYFWRKVADAWTKHQIAEKAMIVELGVLAEDIHRDGINLLYNGYSWWTTSSWNCKLYQASYTNGTGNDKKNMHQESLTDVKKSMENIKFDCTQMGANKANYKEFFGDNKLRWVVRHADGEELNGGRQPAPTAQLQGGCTDVYRYYAEYPDEWTKKDPKGGNGPEVTEAPLPPAQALAAPKIGCILGSDGKFYNTVAEARTRGDAVALVACLNGKKRVEAGSDYNGLAVMLKYKETKPFQTEADLDCGVPYLEALNLLSPVKNGIAQTIYFKDGCGKNHDHPAAKAAYFEAIPNNADFSYAFMASPGQWILAMKGLGMTWNETTGPAKGEVLNNQLNTVKKYFTDAGATDFDVTKLSWASAKTASPLACMFSFKYITQTDIQTGANYANRNLPTLPFIAFKYDGGATED